MITMTRAPATTGGFAAAANGSGLRPVYVGGPGTGLMLVRGPLIPQPTTPTQPPPTPRAPPQPALAAVRCLATAEFQALVANVKREPYDPQRCASLEANVGARKLCAAQVLEPLRAFGQGVTKLRALPVLAPRITDHDHAARSVDSFAFESERREARKALGL